MQMFMLKCNYCRKYTGFVDVRGVEAAACQKCGNRVAIPRIPQENLTERERKIEEAHYALNRNDDIDIPMYLQKWLYEKYNEEFSIDELTKLRDETYAQKMLENYPYIWGWATNNTPPENRHKVNTGESLLDYPMYRARAMCVVLDASMLDRAYRLQEEYPRDCLVSAIGPKEREIPGNWFFYYTDHEKFDPHWIRTGAYTEEK